MRRLARWVALLALVGAAASAAAQVYDFPRYSGAAQIEAECERLLADQKQTESSLEQAVPAGGVLAAIDAMAQRYEDTLGPLALMAAVHPDRPIRDAAEACDLRYQAFNSAFLQNAAVYARLRDVKPADAIDTRFQRDLLDQFEDSGIGLPSAQQARVREINDAVTRLAQDFQRRIREDKRQLPFTAAELAGVPRPVWQDAPRDPQGGYLLGLDYPTVTPVLEKAVSPVARERMWRAFQTQGGADNLQTLAELARLRREMASLFGFASYADFALRRRMAGNEAAVQSFLGEVKEAVRRRERLDLERLRVAKAQHLKQTVATTTLQRWDVAFYADRVRRARYAIDAERFRAYFPPEASLRFVFRLAEKLFGITVEPLEQVLWHPEARAFAVREAQGGRLLGTLFVDLYPRADKYNHAAQWGLRSVSTASARLPVAALVMNFNRRGLSLEELHTLLHEFGHGLHTLLSSTRYASQAGTNVQWDFVEAPSQVFEDWAYRSEPLVLMREVCPRCQPVPPGLIAQADRARRFGKGINVSRQHLFASYDLALHGRAPAEPMALWAAMEAETPLGHVPGSQLPAGFGHLAGGYAAGYYGYLWSEAIAEDLRTPFVGHWLDPSVGRRYRDAVLANGGQAAPAELLQQFLGRPSNRQAFFDALARE